MARHRTEPRRLTRTQWARYERVGLKPNLELDELVLNWTDRRVTDLDAKGALVALSMERTIEGASTVTMTLRDPDGRVAGPRAERAGRIITRRPRGQKAWKRYPVQVDEAWDPILSPVAIGRAVEVSLDGVVFRLVKVRYTHSTTELELTFEDRIVYWLKRKRGAKRANRAKVTRAEFVLSLLHEVKARNYRFVCPELHSTQHVDKPRGASQGWSRTGLMRSTSRAKSTETDDGNEGGFSHGARLTVKGKKVTPAQRRRMAGILNEARRLGASNLVMAACIACATQESVMGASAGTTGNDDTGLYQQGRNWISARDAMDPAKSTRAFLTGAINGGGAPGWKDKHGSLTRAPGGFENAIKKVQVSVGGYRQWEAEAKRTVAAFQGGGGGSAGASWSTKRYQFSRNSDENSWSAMQRLAQEVGWRCFVVGNSVYYMSEAQLYARRPRYEVRPETPSVLEFTFDLDWGKPVSEASLLVALDRWGAPPGSVVVVDGFGPPDGRWLVASVSRDWFSPTAEVRLKQPGKQLLEPANERVQRANNASEPGPQGEGGGDSSKAGQVYDAARRISGRHYPYVWGGGHARAGEPSGGGYDCSGSVVAALAAAGLGYHPGGHVDVSGTIASSWGEPGHGRHFTVWANAGHVWIQFHGMGAWRFDTSPYGSGGRGPRLRSSSRPTSGFTARHWPGC